MDTQELPETMLDQRVTDARDQLTRLSLEAKKADLEVALASKDFEADPTGERFQTKAVAEQKARNAHAQHEACKADVAPVLAEADRRTQLRRLEELRSGPRKWREFTEKTAEQVAQLHEAFVTGLREQLQVFEAAHASFRAACTEHDGLERSFGSGDHVTAPSFEAAFCSLRDRIEERVGKNNHHIGIGDGSSSSGTRIVNASVYFDLPARRV